MSNKTSNKNVANIEDDVKILRKFMNEAQDLNNENGWHGYYDVEIKAVSNAIEHILTEREQDKKRIQELEAENMQKDLEKIGIKEDTEANMKEIIEKFYTANEKCIPKQKVKDKIEKLRNDIKLGNCRYPYVEEHKIDILQELLGGDEKK